MGSLNPRFENDNRRLLRARDLMDRKYWDDLDVTGLGQVAAMSRAHVIRSFKETFGETPHRICKGGGWRERCTCSEPPSVK
jgi:transcriptional regulator GlxA family with amidase domain